MVNYIRCGHCLDEDPACGCCNGSGYQEKKTIKTRLKEILYCIFPCLNKDNKTFEYKSVPTETNFYNDLFSAMNDMESTSLVEENNPELELNSDDFDSDNEEVGVISSGLIKPEEVANRTVKKIDIPNNGYNHNCPSGHVAVYMTPDH